LSAMIGRARLTAALTVILPLTVVLVLALTVGCQARKPIPQTNLTPQGLRSLLTSAEGQAAFREAFMTMYRTSEGRAALRDVILDLFQAPDTSRAIRSAMAEALGTVPGRTALIQALGSAEVRPTLVSVVSDVLSTSSFRSAIREMIAAAVHSAIPKTPAVPTPSAPGTGR